MDPGVPSATLRAILGAPSPGTVVVRTRHAVDFPRKETGEVVTLEPGQIVFVDSPSANVGVAVKLHLFGDTNDSELRFGLGIMLGFGDRIDRGLPLHSYQAACVDSWIDQHVTLEIRAETSQGGLLNGMRDAWLENGAVWPRR